MKLPVKAALLAVALLLSSLVATPSASAGTLCNVTLICGKITNISGPQNILLVHNWAAIPPAHPADWDRALPPGHRSDEYWNDNDGWYSPSHQCTSVYKRLQAQWIFQYNRSPGWYKISDTDQLGLIAWSC